MITISDIYSIPQQTVYRWEVDKGVFRSIEQMDGLGKRATIERNKMIYVRDQAVSDSPEGLGLFRQVVIRCHTAQGRSKKLEENAYKADIGGMPLARVPLSDLEAQYP